MSNLAYMEDYLGYEEEIQDLEISYDEILESEVEESIAGTFSAEEALLMSKERFQTIDFEYMKGLTGLTIDELIAELGGKHIWQNPAEFALTEDERDGWQLPEEYFYNKNIMMLLEEAKELNVVYGRFDANIEQLEKMLPKKKSIDHVRFLPGNSVLTGEIHGRYIQDRKKLSVIPKVVNMGHKWLIHKPDVKKYANFKSPFETDFMDFYAMMGHLMNGTLFDAIVNSKTMEKISSSERKERILVIQEKAFLLQEDFNNWIHSIPDIREEVEELYYRKYCFVQPEYDTSILKLKDLNPQIVPYAHQKVGILKGLTNKNLLLNHSTGAGKTLTMVILAYEAKKMGLTSKTLIVAPPESFYEFVDTFKRAYPNAKVLAIRPKSDFTKAKQRETLRKIKDGDYTAIIMQDSSFNEIDMSREYYLKKKEKEIRTCRREIVSAGKGTPEERVLKRKLKHLEDQLEKLQLTITSSVTECFEDLGITMLMVDECHNYKNITLDSNINVAGTAKKGSLKSDSLLEKVHHVQKEKGKVIFATGTPLVNSLADLYTLQKYLQPNELEFCGISKFALWVNSFAQCETTFDLDIMLNPRFITRFTSFYNLTELRSLFGKVCDTYYANKEELNLPNFQGHTNIVVEKSQEQSDYDKEILKRWEAIHLKLVGKREDNPLLLTMDARNASTDIRLVKDGLDDKVTYSKASVCADKMVELYKKHPGTTQIAFCDCSTPKSTFNIYDELRKQLELRGIPADEIAYIHDGSTEAKRKKLLADFNAGKIRFMIGSTKKLGTGVNVQENLVAVHHIDVPWRPADFTQREGRIIRQGNKNEQVYVFRYITKNSFDAYMWQLIESKQKFIDCFLAGELDPETYDVSDISDIILSYAEAKALAIGNPLIKQRVETSNEIEKLRILQRKRRRELTEFEEALEEIPEKGAKLKRLIEQGKEDIRHYKQNKESLGQEEREAFGAELLEELQRNTLQPKERVFDSYQGFDVVLPKNMSQERPYVILKRKNGGSYYIKMDGDKALGCSKRLDYFLEHLPQRSQEQKEELLALKRNFAQAKAEISKGNPYDQELLDAIERLNAIDKQLNAD